MTERSTSLLPWERSGRTSRSVFAEFYDSILRGPQVKRRSILRPRWREYSGKRQEWVLVQGEIMRWVRTAAKQGFLALHRFGIRGGAHLLPVHYYSPVPNILELRRTEHIWARKSTLPGLTIDLDEQTATLRTVCLPYRGKYAGNSIYHEAVSHHLGQGYGYIEAQVLHAFVRHYQPGRILEVGSGVSTYCMAKAAEMNTGTTTRVTTMVSIDPYASDHLMRLPHVELLRRPVQTVPMELFTELRENDLFFIDSTHTVKPGSDVNFLILEVLPRLHRGVLVHFYDITFPYDYQRNVYQTVFHWTETSLLRAFLISNEKARVLCCLSHLHYERQEALRELFQEYTPQPDVNGLAPVSVTNHFPSSLYLRMQ